MIRNVVILIWVLFSPSQVLSDTCSRLASTFANNPDALKPDHLADLRQCVDDKLQETAYKTDTDGQKPSPSRDNSSIHFTKE
jgi:hypothetical protein